MTERATNSQPADHPKRLLTQNSELRRIGVYNWSLPALAARLPDGRTIATCPSAGVCAQVCYARNGTYNIPTVRARHLANLIFVLDEPELWEATMSRELDSSRFAGRWIRIHDAGDFFSDSYLSAWLRIIEAHPNTRFYAYTKEVDRFRRMVEPSAPQNFLWVYSFGGTQDASLRPPSDRVADVFPSEEAILRAGWHSQERSDLLAVTGPAPVGIPANRIPRFRRRQGDRTFRQWQAQTRSFRARRHVRSCPPIARRCPSELRQDELRRKCCGDHPKISHARNCDVEDDAKQHGG
jgi:Gene product 88